ncbi:hypothetical protein MUP38_08175 [Candidatus Bathyarchaeota archaeon]|nr:hypothetical protein [Candidatus Bathyarchaeota archaeon]
MSLKRSKDVPKLVEKYRAKYPQLDRDLLRRLIRLEHPDLFDEKRNKNYASNLKKLDRYLRKAFENELSGQPLPRKSSDDLVERALLKLAKEQNKTTMEEVASEVGIPPSSIELSVYRLVQKYGWKTSKTRLGEVEIDFNKPFDPGAFKFG